VLIDVTPLSLGIEQIGGVMDPVIPRGTVIPAKKSKMYTTTVDRQPAIGFPVFEGERPLTKDNHKLGSFRLSVPPAKKGVPAIKVTFELDENSILTVTAFDEATKKKNSITITNEKGRLTQEEIERMVAEAEKYAEEDKKTKEALEAKRQLESYISQMSSSISEKGTLHANLPKEDLTSINDALSDT